jgi:hypothetical protein
LISDLSQVQVISVYRKYIYILYLNCHKNKITHGKEVMIHVRVKTRKISKARRFVVIGPVMRKKRHRKTGKGNLRELYAHRAKFFKTRKNK